MKVCQIIQSLILGHGRRDGRTDMVFTRGVQFLLCKHRLLITLTLIRLLQSKGTVACLRIHLAVEPTHKPHCSYQTIYPSHRVHAHIHTYAHTSKRTSAAYNQLYNNLPITRTLDGSCYAMCTLIAGVVNWQQQEPPLHKSTDLLSGCPECLVNLL